MLRSMTGFGRCVMEDADWTQTWEIRSVNNRHLDLKWRLPLQARGLESRLERVVRRFAARGRMEITLTLQQRGAAANLRFDAAQASAMLDQVAALADLHGDTFEPDYNALFAIPTLWERESEDGETFVPTITCTEVLPGLITPATPADLITLSFTAVISFTSSRSLVTQLSMLVMFSFPPQPSRILAAIAV